MTRALLDINVLVALLDADHTARDRALAWVAAEEGPDWASCAITQNGFVRIISQPRYPNPVPVGLAMDKLARRCAMDDHEFWPCDLSLLDRDVVDRRALLGPKQISDAYLLALAVHRGGRLVTFDRSLPLSAVVGASEDHRVVL